MGIIVPRASTVKIWVGLTSIFPGFCVFLSVTGGVLEKGVTFNPPVANPGGVSIYLHRLTQRWGSFILRRPPGRRKDGHC